MPKRSKLVLDFPLFFQLIITLFSVYVLFDTGKSFNGVVALILGNVAVSLLLIVLRQRRVFTLYFCFMLFLALFHFGQLVLYVFGARVEQRQKQHKAEIKGENPPLPEHDQEK